MDNSEGQNLDERAQKRLIVLALHRMGALKFGEFTLKSGVHSPMYLDLRLFVSYPKVLKQAAKAYASIIKPLKYDRLAGIAYAALPITGAVSLEMDQPWIYMYAQRGPGQIIRPQKSYRRGVRA